MTGTYLGQRYTGSGSQHYIIDEAAIYQTALAEPRIASHYADRTN